MRMTDLKDIVSQGLNTFSATPAPGRLVRLYAAPNGKEVTAILEDKLILGEDLVLNVSSTFSPVMNASTGLTGHIVGKLVPSAAKLVNAFTSGTTYGGYFKAQGVNIWESTSPLSFSITIALYMENSGKEQVMDPTRELMKLVVPDEQGGFLLPPGPSAIKAFGDALAGMTNGKSGPSSAIPDYTTYKIVIGNYLYLDDIIITRAEPIISSDTDTEQNPIWSKVRLDIQTTTTCTKQMIDKFENARTAFNNDVAFNNSLVKKL